MYEASQLNWCRLDTHHWFFYSLIIGSMFSWIVAAVPSSISKPIHSLVDSMAADNLATEGRIKLPGFGLPLEHLPGNGVPPIGTSQAGSSHRGVYLGRPTKPQDANSDTRKRLYFPIFSTDTEESWKGCTHLIREACMLKVIEELTNKPEWWRKVRDEEIASKWKKEMLEMDWKKYRQFADFTHDMAETVSKLLSHRWQLVLKLSCSVYGSCARKQSCMKVPAWFLLWTLLPLSSNLTTLSRTT